MDDQTSYAVVSGCVFVCEGKGVNPTNLPFLLPFLKQTTSLHCLTSNYIHQWCALCRWYRNRHQNKNGRQSDVCTYIYIYR